MTQHILYEDNHLIAVNKVSSDIVQGDSTGDATLADDVRAHLKEVYGKSGNVFLGIIHRIDRPASGVVLFAKTGKALSRMNREFQEGRVEKTYWAITEQPPDPPEGRLVHHLTRNRKLNKSFAAPSESAGSKAGSLTYRLRGNLDRYFWLEIGLETGRHHQIRAQLAAMGITIKGDLKYGASRSNRGGGIHLHAREIAFTHPVTGKEVRISAPPPADPLWDAVMAMCGEDR